MLITSPAFAARRPSAFKARPRTRYGTRALAGLATLKVGEQAVERDHFGVDQILHGVHDVREPRHHT
jgi:hypothetical protein